MDRLWAEVAAGAHACNMFFARAPLCSTLHSPFQNRKFPPRRGTTERWSRLACALRPSHQGRREARRPEAVSSSERYVVGAAHRRSPAPLHVPYRRPRASRRAFQKVPDLLSGGGGSAHARKSSLGRGPQTHPDGTRLPREIHRPPPQRLPGWPQRRIWPPPLPQPCYPRRMRVCVSVALAA